MVNYFVSMYLMVLKLLNAIGIAIFEKVYIKWPFVFKLRLFMSVNVFIISAFLNAFITNRRE